MRFRRRLVFDDGFGPVIRRRNVTMKLTRPHLLTVLLNLYTQLLAACETTPPLAGSTGKNQEMGPP
jgi:hypothetical protein